MRKYGHTCAPFPPKYEKLAKYVQNMQMQYGRCYRGKMELYAKINNILGVTNGNLLEELKQ